MIYDPGHLDDLEPSNRMLLCGMAGEALVNCIVDGEKIGPRTLESLVYWLQDDEADSPRLYRFLSTLVLLGVLDQTMVGLPLETVIARLEESPP